MRGLLLLIFSFFVFLGSCRITQRYNRPNVQTSHLFRDLKAGDTLSIARIPWQTYFSDTVLLHFIQEGIANNLNLKIAMQRIAEAQATFRQSQAAFYPTLNANLNLTRSKQSLASLNLPAGVKISTVTTAYQASLTTVWEADIWGQLSSVKRGAYARLLASDAARRAVQTQLIADIANNYYLLLAHDKELEILEQTLQNRIKDVVTIKVLKEGAVVNGAAVVQSEANRYAAEVAIPDIKRTIRETENALDLLLGRPPGTLNRSKLESQRNNADLSTGIPAELLQNRPDVQEAEYAFRSAFEYTNAAKTYFYPSLTITASGGFSNFQLKNFFVNSIFYNIAAGLTQPIFNQNLNKARLKVARAQQLEALYNFEQTLLTAGGEVSDALYAYQSASDKGAARSKQITALQKAVEYTQLLLRYSSATNFTDVLTSEQNLLAGQLSGVNDRLQQLQATVNLYRALGGGWK